MVAIILPADTPLRPWGWGQSVEAVPWMELGTTGYKASDLSTILRRVGLRFMC